MNIVFDSSVACRYGVNEAIMIQNIAFWLAKNHAEGRHFYEGRTWTPCTLKGVAKLYPFWSFKQVRVVFNSLKKNNLIISGKFSDNPMYQTKWYTFSDDFIREIGNDFPHLLPDGIRPNEMPEELNGDSHFPKGQIDVPKRANAFAQIAKSSTSIDKYYHCEEDTSLKKEKDSIVPTENKFSSGTIDVQKKKKSGKWVDLGGDSCESHPKNKAEKIFDPSPLFRGTPLPGGESPAIFEETPKTAPNLNDNSADDAEYHKGGENKNLTGKNGQNGGEKKTLFRNSSVYAMKKGDDYSEFIAQFAGREWEDVDLVYYFNTVADWSDMKDMKRTTRGWMATVRQFIRSDFHSGKLRRLSTAPVNVPGLTEEIEERYKALGIL